MKKDQIRAACIRAHEQLVGSFVDAGAPLTLTKILDSELFIAGGAISSMLLDESVNDYDFYFTNSEKMEEVMQFCLDWFIRVQGAPNTDVTIEIDEGEVPVPFSGKKFRIASSGIVKSFKKDPKAWHYPICISENAVSFSKGVQLVLKFAAPAEDMVGSFDFAHCTNYFDCKYNKLVLNGKAVESLISKELIYMPTHYPVATFFRTRKFIKRGFTMSAGQMLKLMMQISKLDLTDTKVLMAQIQGVDITYLNALREKLLNLDDGISIDADYVISLIETLEEDPEAFNEEIEAYQARQ